MLLCERFGYDSTKIQQQLQLVGLSADDHRLVEHLHAEVISPHMRAVVARFYRVLKGDARFWEVLSRGVSLPRLHRSQVNALQSLGRDFDTQGYFERRLRIGVAHARAQVPLELYLGGYRVLAQELLDRVPSASPRAASYRSLILKLLMLEMAVVAGTYHQADLEELKGLLSKSRTETDRQRERARRDSLTSTFNRDHIYEVLQTAMEGARRHGRPMAVAMLDLDRFKPVNDAHGHAVGDEALREVVARMRASIRDGDTLGRYGGDEFLLVLDGVSPAEAHEVVDRLRARIASEPVRLGSRAVPVTISVGLAALADDKTAAELVERADRALYRAKRSGRNQVCFDARDAREAAITLDRFPAAAELLESSA